MPLIVFAASFQYIFSILLFYKYGTLSPFCPQFRKQYYCQPGLYDGILGIKEAGISELRLKAGKLLEHHDSGSDC